MQQTAIPLTKNSNKTDEYEVSVTVCETDSIKALRNTHYDNSKMFQNSAYNLKSSTRRNPLTKIKNENELKRPQQRVLKFLILAKPFVVD
jgi:hypothetical protein